ncbi:MAG: hypothetical protein NVSMB57_05830 [Actinomycetota bacterium]
MGGSILLVVVVVASIALQASNLHGSYRTVEGIAAALSSKHVSCFALRIQRHPKAGARQQGECTTDGGHLVILTYDRPSARKPPADIMAASTVVVSGDTWLIEAPNVSVARRVAGALGGRVANRVEHG